MAILVGLAQAQDFMRNGESIMKPHFSVPIGFRMFEEPTNFVLCVFGTCRALVFSVEVFHTRCSLDISHQSVFVSLRALDFYIYAVSFFDFDVTSFARRVRRLSRDRRCENNHHHHMDSWWRSYGFFVSAKSYDSMEISGEDDQTNSAGARPTGRDLQQQQRMVDSNALA